MKLPKANFVLWTAVISAGTVLFVLPLVNKFMGKATEKKS